MAARAYRLGPRRQAGAARTRSGILAAAREVVSELGPESSVGRVAERAGVSRITIYDQFGSKAGLLDALSADTARPPMSEAPEETRRRPRRRSQAAYRTGVRRLGVGSPPVPSAPCARTGRPSRLRPCARRAACRGRSPAAGMLDQGSRRRDRDPHVVPRFRSPA